MRESDWYLEFEDKNSDDPYTSGFFIDVYGYLTDSNYVFWSGSD